MSDIRLKDLPKTASESDLVSGNYLALDGANGTMKLPAENVAKRSVQDSLVIDMNGYDDRQAVTNTISFSLSSSQSSYTQILEDAIPSGTKIKVTASDFSSLTDNLSVSVRFRDSSNNIIGGPVSVFGGGEVNITLEGDAASFGVYRLKEDIVASGTADFTLEYETGTYDEGVVPPIKESVDKLEESNLTHFGKPADIVEENCNFALTSASSNYDFPLSEEIPAGKVFEVNVDDFSSLISGSHSISIRPYHESTKLDQKSIFNGTLKFGPFDSSVTSIRGYIFKDYIASSGRLDFYVKWDKEPAQDGDVGRAVEEVTELYGTELVPYTENGSVLSRTDGVNYRYNLLKIIPKGKKFRITCGDISSIITQGGFGFRPADKDNVILETAYLESGQSYEFGPFDEDVVYIRGYVNSSYVSAAGLSIDFTIDWKEGVDGRVPEVEKIADEAKRYGSDVLRANHSDETFASMASTFNESIFNFGVVNSGKRIELRRVLKGVMNGSQGAGCTSDGLCVVMSDSQYHKQLAFIDMNHFKVLQSGKFDQNNVNYHNNSLFFGTEKYDVSDPYPLLYASQGKNTEHCILVYRILVNDGVYSLDLVQTITLPDVSADYKLSAGDSFLGNDGYLWVVGLDRTDPDNVTEYVIAKFTMPTLSQGDVTLTESDALDYYTLPYVATAQGGCIGANGYLYKMRSSGIIVIDLQNHLQLDAQSMYMQGYEIESCFFHHGTMYINAIEDASLTESGLDETDIWQVKFING